MRAKVKINPREDAPQLLSSREAADILGVSLARVNQLIHEPCPRCRIWDEDGPRTNRKGCPYCRFTGKRLPVIGRFGTGEKAPFVIDRRDLQRVLDERRIYPIEDLTSIAVK